MFGRPIAGCVVDLPASGLHDGVAAPRVSKVSSIQLWRRAAMMATSACAEGCLGGVALMALAPQQIRRLRGAIPCPWRGRSCVVLQRSAQALVGALEDAAPFLSTVDAARCAAAMRDMVSYYSGVEAGLLANRDAGQVPAARADEAAPSPAAVAAQLQHTGAPSSSTSSLRCPRRRAAFADFAGCDTAHVRGVRRRLVCDLPKGLWDERPQPPSRGAVPRRTRLLRREERTTATTARGALVSYGRDCRALTSLQR